MGNKILHFVKWLKGGHHDLDILEFLIFGQDEFRLVLAMVALGAEIDDKSGAMLFQIILGQVGGAVRLEQVEGGDGGDFW